METNTTELSKSLLTRKLRRETRDVAKELFTFKLIHQQSRSISLGEVGHIDQPTPLGSVIKQTFSRIIYIFKNCPKILLSFNGLY